MLAVRHLTRQDRPTQ